MKDFLEKLQPVGECVIYYLYHNENEPMPTCWSDPLELMGDMTRLQLTDAQMRDLRDIVSEEIRSEGPEAVWKGRTLRKNIIHSCGYLV
jgi:hypothetical protein